MMLNQFQQLQIDIRNSTYFKQKLTELYSNELNETLEKILLKPEGEFMRSLANRVRTLLSKEYSEDIYEDCGLTSLLRTVEKEVYLALYKPLKNNLIALQTEDKKGKQKLTDFTRRFSLRKHCNFQNDSILHKCSDGQITSSFIYNNEYFICLKCLIVNRLSCAKLYCNFCSIEYYTTLIDNNTEEVIDSNLQPATWDKYHCNIVFNDQMKCIQCKDKLYLNLIDNELKCLKCGFHLEPQAILWKCIICSSEFRSNAKIYNPLEYKMFKNAIKEALVKKEYAKPEQYPCSHNNIPEVMIHKSTCDGRLLIGYYHDTKMVICDKCNVATLHNKFIWTCSICNKRFRDYKDKKLIRPLCDDDTISYASSTFDSFTYNDRYNSFNSRKANDEGSLLTDRKNDTFNSNSTHNTSRNSNSSNKLEFKNKLKEITNLPPIKLASSIPLIDLESYWIISEIAEGASSKVYAVKDSDSQFHALKRQHYDISKLEGYRLHYSITSENIVKVKGYAIDKEQNELCVLEELGLCDLEKEIVSRKRSKKYYSETELMNMLYNITSALCHLQINGYVHWNISPYNIISFKDGSYKLCDFASMRKVKENKWENENNHFSPPENQINDMIKADVFCLGLTMVYASTLDYQPVEDIIGLNYAEKDLRQVNDQLRKIINSNFLKEKFSNQYLEMLLSILNANVNERMHFLELYKYITTKYNKLE